MSEITPYDMLNLLDSRIDGYGFSSIFASSRRNKRGRPPVPNCFYFRAHIVRFLFGITSYRSLISFIKNDPLILNFCRVENVPHHSWFSKFHRNPVVDKIKELFDKLIFTAYSQQQISFKHIMTDGSLIKASASNIKSKKVVVGENRKKISITDPDSAWVAIVGKKFGFYYKIHVSIDSESLLITDLSLTPGDAHESVEGEKILSKHLESFDGSLKEYTADKAYGTAAIFKRALENHVTPNISLKSSILKNPKGFRYSKDDDVYICNNSGVVLYPYKPSTIFTRYRVKDNTCSSCKKRPTCKAKFPKGRAPRAVIYRNHEYSIFESIRSLKSWQRRKPKLIERSWKMEGKISDLKANGLQTMPLRSSNKATWYSYLVAWFCNLKRLALIDSGEIKKRSELKKRRKRVIRNLISNSHSISSFIDLLKKIKSGDIELWRIEAEISSLMYPSWWYPYDGYFNIDPEAN